MFAKLLRFLGSAGELGAGGSSLAKGSSAVEEAAMASSADNRIGGCRFK